LFWDGTDTNANNANGGNGTWDLATTNWDTLASGGGNSLWTNSGTASIANFGGTAGSVTLNTNVNALRLVFTTPGYTVSGSGTLTLASGTAGTLVGISTSSLTSGITTISNNISIAGPVNAVQEWSLGAGTTLNASGTLSMADSIGLFTTGPGTLNLSGGTALAPTIQRIGDFSVGSTGTANISGFYNSAGRILSAGTLNLSGTFALAGERATVGTANGTINLTGSLTAAANAGTFIADASNRSGAALFIGNGNTNTATVNINGGSFVTASPAAILVGGGNGTTGAAGTAGNGHGNGTLNIASGLFSTAATVFQLGSSNGTAGSGTVNLNGGVLAITNSITKGSNGSSTGTFNFNGGTLRALANTATLSGLTAANVQTGGANIDTNGFSIAIGQVLAAGSPSGGLTKTNTGTLTLTGANTYTGGTTISQGTARINNTVGSGTGTGAVSVSSGAILGGSGTITGATTLTTATLAPGSADATAGTTNFGAGLAFNSNSIFEWDMQQAATTDPGPAATNAGVYDKVVLTGAAGSLTGSAATFKIVLGSDKSFTDAFWDTNKTWNDIFTGSGIGTSLASVFSAFNADGSNLVGGVVPNQGTFTLSGSSTLNWTAVPEPTSALAGVLLAAGLLRRRRGI